MQEPKTEFWLKLLPPLKKKRRAESSSLTQRKKKPQKGKVLSISEVDEKGNKPTVKVGDTILYGKYAGTEINVEGKEYLIMRESDIFAIL